MTNRIILDPYVANEKLSNKDKIKIIKSAINIFKMKQWRGMCVCINRALMTYNITLDHNDIKILFPTFIYENYHKFYIIVKEVRLRKNQPYWDNFKLMGHYRRLLFLKYMLFKQYIKTYLKF